MRVPEFRAALLDYCARARGARRAIRSTAESMMSKQVSKYAGERPYGSSR